MITFVLCAALVGFTYDAVTGRRFIVRTTSQPPTRSVQKAAVQGTAAGREAQEQAAPAVHEAPVQQTAAPERARILIFTARPGSIVTRRTTDLCYAVSNALQTRIEPTVGDVETTDTLSCRRVAPPRTTTYELTAMGRDGVPVSQQLVIVVR